MGQQLLPPGDSVSVCFDTIIDIHAYPVSGKPPVTYERYHSSSTLFLLGQIKDSLVGKSTASLVTQFNSTSTFIPAPNLEIDSIILHLYIDDYLVDEKEQLLLSVFEMKERIYIDTSYRSNYDIAGKFEPDSLLAMQRLSPMAGDTVEILFDRTSAGYQGFREKFYKADTARFTSDSLFKNYFNGFYLTATSVTETGNMTTVGLANLVSRLTLRYRNDSTILDSTTTNGYTWATFPIDEYYAQKINIFEHEVEPGSYLSSVIDKDSMRPDYCFVQGMAGVNTKLVFENPRNWMPDEQIAINSATLIIEAAPGTRSGLETSDLPERLMLYTELDDGSLEAPYDYLTLSSSDDDLFGGILEPEADGMFDPDTLYVYRFNMGLHFQSMIDGVKPDSIFRLQLYDPLVNPAFSILSGNPDREHARIRLEIVYLKL